MSGHLIATIFTKLDKLVDVKQKTPPQQSIPILDTNINSQNEPLPTQVKPKNLKKN